MRIYRDNKNREADALVQFEDDSWALIEVKLANPEEISLASKKLVSLAADIDNNPHPKPASLLIVTASGLAHRNENGF